MYQLNPLLLLEAHVDDTRGSGLRLEVHKGGFEGNDVPHFHIYTPKMDKDDSGYFECCLEFRNGSYFNHKKLLHRPFNAKQKKQILAFLGTRYKSSTVWDFLVGGWNKRYPKNSPYRVYNKMPDYSGIPTIGTI